ncbi:hypothetical protein LZ30DRAFT_303560 [Colletotrichum cereale]|nr:hypothetical protein LZ30DRAFT_303560 [Colletotrichum cereale]
MPCHKKQNQKKIMTKKANFPRSRSRSQSKPRHASKQDSETVGTVWCRQGSCTVTLSLDPNENHRSTKPCHCLSTLWRRGWGYPPGVSLVVPMHPGEPNFHRNNPTASTCLHIHVAVHPPLPPPHSSSSTNQHTPMHLKLVDSPASCRGSTRTLCRHGTTTLGQL